MVKPLSRIAMSAIPSSTAAKTAQARWQLGRKRAASPVELKRPAAITPSLAMFFATAVASHGICPPAFADSLRRHMPRRSLGCGRDRPSAAPLSPLLRRSRSSCQTRPQTPALADSLRGGLWRYGSGGGARAVSGIKDAPPQPSLFT